VHPIGQTPDRAAGVVSNLQAHLRARKCRTQSGPSGVHGLKIRIFVSALLLAHLQSSHDVGCLLPVLDVSRCERAPNRRVTRRVDHGQSPLATPGAFFHARVEADIPTYSRAA
jgi:hypothetical protein